MSPPPADDSKVQAGLSEIADSSVLFRRIRSIDVTQEFGEDGQYRIRPTTACFTDNASPMSLYDSAGCGGVEGVMKGHEGFALVSFQAGDLKALGLEVKRTTHGGPGHCEAIGKKTGSVRTKLARLATWVIYPASSGG